MTAKEYLQQVKLKETKIKNLQRDRESVEDMLYSLCGTGKGERVQTTRNFDKYGTLFGRIDEVEREIEKKIADALDFMLKVSGEIGSLGKSSYITILHSRYIQGRSWIEIADCMDRSERYVLKLHNDALKAFQDQYSEMLQAWENNGLRTEKKQKGSTNDHG